MQQTEQEDNGTGVNKSFVGFPLTIDYAETVFHFPW